MSSIHSISSSMTNLTSVSSVSSTSLASSTGGSKKRRAPKPPALAAVHPPTQIDEETTATDGETSSRGESDCISQQTVGQDQVEEVAQRLEQSTTEPMPVARVPEKKKIEVLSVSPVSSLSSPSHSASESTSSSPIPPTSTEFISKSNSSVMRERSLNTNYNEGNGRGNPLTVEEYVESGSNIPNFSRSSSSPSSSNNNNAIAAASAPSPDSVRSRKLLSSSIAVDDAQSVVEDTSSCRPPSSNTQVTSSSPASQTMPMPLPRRRAPTAPDNASTNIPNNKQTGKSEQMVSEAQPSAHALPKPKPKPRADRISVESMISQTPGIIKPLTRSGTRQSTESSEDSLESETGKHPTLSGQLRNPLAKYGVKVLPDNVVKERENRLRYDAPLHSSDALEGAQNQPISHKVPIRASKSSSSDTTENFSDSGSVTSFSTHSIKKPPPGLSSKPVPTLSKSDYTNPGSIRSIKQLAASASSKSVDADNDDEKHYDSDNLEENLDMFEPANDDDSSLKKSVSSQRAVQKGKENMVAVKLPRRDETTKPPRVSSSVSAYEDLEKESSSDSPGASSESAFTRTASQREFKKAKQAEDASKLNRWQNMVSLNQIENTNGVGSNMSPSRSRNTNKPVVASAEVSTGSMGSSKQTLLHDDFQQSKNRLTVDENQTDAMCHSSESEASYTDSGVPATETVTPSPVNLDDVIPDHEYHSGTHQEKFSSEDAEDVRNSSRRSSLRSDHSEEWMNILEAKMNKDEEAIEKMFEAVLPQTGEELNGFESPIRVGDVAKKETEPSSDEHGFLHENDHILEDETHDTRTKEIETTVELHRPPASIPSEIEHSQMDSHVSASAVPVRKISKSESFSHNSEYDEAKQRRKNFYSARSNALNGSSQSSGSATDLRQSLNMSSSEEEGELSPIHSLAKNATSINRASNKTANSVHQHNHVRDDRAVSMSDLSKENYAAESAGRNASTNPTKTNSSDQNTKIVQKAMSLQKLPGDALDEGVAMDTYRKQLEMQFEQWKEEFMKTHVKTDENDESMKVEPQFQQVEQTSDSEVSKSELGKTVTEPIANEKESPKLRVELPQVILTGGSFSETSTDSDSKPALRSEPVQDTPREENLLKNKESDPDVINTTVNKEETGEPEMKDTEEFQKVELRKKKESPPQVIYQYSGPPTIKMASWTERPRRAVSVKKDDDYIMGFGQQDPNAKSLNAARIHSFHGGPVIPMAQLQADNDSPLKNNRESSPTPSVHVKGWSAALNATNATPNSTGAVRNVLSAWKQKMEETEMEKNKPKEGPPAEIDMYGSENTEKVQPKLITSIKKSEIVTNAPSNIKTAPKVNESLNDKQVKPVVVQVSSAAKPEPKILEKSKTLGSSFRTEKPMVFTMSSMDSNSNTLPKTRPVTIHNPSDVVDHKPSPATSTVEITSGSSLQERKKFFQGVSPVQNGKEAPIPATNLKSNIAVIQKVFEKQRTTKMQQMGSQQSLYSEGTISPSSSLQRNDSIDSRKSNINNFQRKNSVESHSSDSSSVILRVSQNTSGKSSPQFSSTEMVQKLFGRPNSNSFNLDPSRRTPSPISSTTSTLSSSTSYERFTPSPTVVDGPNNSVRITTGGYKPPNIQSSAVTPSIRSVGNKAIITVNGNDGAKNTKNDKKVEKSPVANDIILEGGKISPKRPSVTSTYMTVIGQQQAANRVSVPAKSVPVATKKMSVESVDSQKNASNGIPPPPPPPSAGLNFPSLSSEKLKFTPAASNSRNSNPMTPTTPTSPNPRDEIFNAIKNGNFGLKKTKSSNILLK
ncbi:unnamed protein product [Orchesella dallaii]|uniref:WH2 domain-containing protein n=1 Tax=Orchesella dallaii TaxID=48710 RepID=A0ABP1QXS2_9HEXA